ncbi:sulfite exporter TauE/SafE family protein [Methylobacterium gnaphalii]|uniref:Probable membrane transporter protein n=1 Tax=Methylobacterium gnaphalii TaxID=1010610 RepID=A0A512JNH5_9HYPH|nr:sulfite exporter TauE/SafE family protein [Methylobacterium gnaphalii]GEP11509.1 UPF0721 transmembrane protein y4hK [Methylobacterium gnaphalii]GJD70157.1 hypothetical protein MMMDOFMJ_3099 [Methylobacterium gnaphalii]GLS49513.1 UPF0721 transmembrane protein y4hK [Methylobacterium gnaphalii]
MSGYLFAAAIALVAALYSAVGQAGGTGYVALMSLAGFAPAIMKPSALALNILVSAIGTARFAKAGMLTWRSCYPFAVLGAPFSVFGGATHLDPSLYRPVVGVLMMAAAVPTLRGRYRPDDPIPHDPPFLPALITGAGIGFASGVTGVGGGIFLAPLILAMRWVQVRQAAAISVVFNLLNSCAALMGSWATLSLLPSELPMWLLAVAAGGFAGSWLAVQHLPVLILRWLLTALLVVAGLRMLIAA